MTNVSALMLVADQQPVTDCPGPERCEFTTPRVRWYLVCWRLALVTREPFHTVLRSEARLSRDVDPWARGGRVDPGWALNIGLSLEHARDQHGLTLAAWNAEKISAVLCRGPHNETAR